MARGEFDKCPQCGIGTLKPTGGTAKMTDPDTGTATADYSECKCDNCGYPQGGKAKVVAANEQAAISETRTPLQQAAQRLQRQRCNQQSKQ